MIHAAPAARSRVAWRARRLWQQQRRQQRLTSPATSTGRPTAFAFHLALCPAWKVTLATLAKQAASDGNAQSTSGQIRDVQLVRLPPLCKTVGSAYVGSNPTPATLKPSGQGQCAECSSALPRSSSPGWGQRACRGQGSGRRATAAHVTHRVMIWSGYAEWCAETAPDSQVVASGWSAEHALAPPGHLVHDRRGSAYVGSNPTPATSQAPVQHVVACLTS